MKRHFISVVPSDNIGVFWIDGILGIVLFVHTLLRREYCTC